MSDGFKVSVQQVPSRTIPVAPFEAASRKTLESLDAMEHRLRAAYSDLDESKNKQPEDVGDYYAKFHDKALATAIDQTARSLDALGEISDQLTRFTVAMSITQSFGKNMQSFLRGQ